MKRKINITFLLLVVIALSFTLSACTGSAASTASGWAGLTTDEDTAYIAFNAQVVAVNLTNGTERWRFPAEPDSKITFYADPALTEDGRLIVGGYDNVLYSINTDTGQGGPIFDGSGGRYIGGSLVASEMIFAPSADHNLYALNLNGQEVWHFETGEPLWAKPAIDQECSCIFVPSMDHKVHALDVITGRLIWESDDLGGAIVGTPAISDDDVVYVGTFNKELVALEAGNGREIWRFGTQDWVWSGPTLDDDTLYFGDLSGTFYAVNRQNGVSKWQIQPGGAIVGKPLVTEENIYFGTENGSLIALDKNGSILWNQPYQSEFHHGPVMDGDAILATTSDPETLLIAIDPSGVQKWSFTLVK
jgi:outer membrane protein assembly factor BamB